MKLLDQYNRTVLGIISAEEVSHMVESKRYTPKPGEIVAGLYTSDYKTGYKNQLLITIDDVLFEKDTLEIQLDVLKKYGIKATFFLVGDYLARAPKEKAKALLEKMIADGHALGHHTWGHEYAIKSSRTEFIASLDKTQVKLDEILGYHYHLKYYRPPYGQHTEANRQALADIGMYFIHWNITPSDWSMNYAKTSTAYLLPQDIINNTLKDANKMHGGVILLHTFPKTAAIFEDIIKALLKEKNDQGGYAFVSIDELMNLKYNISTEPMVKNNP